MNAMKVRFAGAGTVLVTLALFASTPASGSELCFLSALGYVADCSNDFPPVDVVGAAGFSTPDVPPCPETLAPFTLFTISASATNPNITVAELQPGQTSLYLWSYSVFANWTALFCTVSGDIPLLGFESPYEHELSINGDGLGGDLFLAPPCDGEPLIQPIGEFRIVAPTAVEGQSWGQLKGLYR